MKVPGVQRLISKAKRSSLLNEIVYVVAGSGTNQGGNVFRAELERELKWSFTEGSPWEAADPSRQRCEVLTAADSVVCGKAS